MLESVEPVRRRIRSTIDAEPTLSSSLSSSRTAPSTLRPFRYVPFLLPRSSRAAPSSPTTMRACRRETDSSSIQTTAAWSRPMRLTPGFNAISRWPQINRYAGSALEGGERFPAGGTASSAQNA